jgi:hypothetical protein
VVICLPRAALTGIAQERDAAPSMCTVQAPHWAMPQPYFVPVSPAARATPTAAACGLDVDLLGPSIDSELYHDPSRWLIRGLPGCC